MLISRELDYALRILRGLGDGDMHTMRALCEEELIPQKFAYKIIRKLAAADYIHAVRGVGGGVRLAADLSALTLFDLLKVFEPELHRRRLLLRVDRGDAKALPDPRLPRRSGVETGP